MGEVSILEQICFGGRNTGPENWELGSALLYGLERIIIPFHFCFRACIAKNVNSPSEKDVLIFIR